MSNDVNQCNFIGRIGKDPETRYASNGDAICNFSIACGWKSKEKEGTEWVPVTAFGKLAEICGQYLKKGSQVFISGRFTTRSWDDKDGNKRYMTEIRADQMQMLGGKSSGDEPKTSSHEPAREHAKAKQDGFAPQSSDFKDMSDDIPF